MNLPRKNDRSQVIIVGRDVVLTTASKNAGNITAAFRFTLEEATLIGNELLRAVQEIQEKNK